MEQITVYEWGKLLFNKNVEYTVDSYDISDKAIFLWRCRNFTSESLVKIDEKKVSFDPRGLFISFLWITPCAIDEKYAKNIYDFDPSRIKKSIFSKIWTEYINALAVEREEEEYDPMLFNIYTVNGEVIKGVNAEDFLVELRDSSNKPLSENEVKTILGFEPIDKSYALKLKKEEEEMKAQEEVTHRVREASARGCCGGKNKK